MPRPSEQPSTAPADPLSTHPSVDTETSGSGTPVDGDSVTNGDTLTNGDNGTSTSSPVAGQDQLADQDEGAELDEEDDYDDHETRMRFLEKGDRADLLEIIDHATGNR